MDDRSDKFVWAPHDIILSQCAYCLHLDRSSPAAVCSAFPSEIPAEILGNHHDHRKPWTDPETDQAGDGGIPLERSITFEPRAGIDPVMLERLYRRLDAI
jgi:hypothetical protein